MKIDILEVKIDNISKEELIDKIKNFIKSENQYQIVTANPEIVLAAQNNPAYKKLINNADVVVADGIGLLWAAKYLSLKKENLFFNLIYFLSTIISLLFNSKYNKSIIPERMTGVDLIDDICKLATIYKWKIYFLGGKKDIAKKAANQLNKKYTNLNIVGFDEGCPIIKQLTENQNEIILKKINQTAPDILFVAFGFPQQDFWLKQNLSKLSTVKLAFGVGGAFDFISQKVKRAPKFLIKLNLEWLYRLIKQPWRIKRIFTATIKFIYLIVKYKGN